MSTKGAPEDTEIRNRSFATLQGCERKEDHYRLLCLALLDQVAEEAVLLAEETEEEKDREGWLAVLMAWPAEMEMIALAERTASALALALAGALEFRSGSAEVAAEAEAGLSVLLRFLGGGGGVTGSLTTVWLLHVTPEMSVPYRTTDAPFSLLTLAPGYPASLAISAVASAASSADFAGGTFFETVLHPPDSLQEPFSK
ncbi:MAG: hypothetical protein HYU05_01245 [Candidatus Wildermuthbacteria bacterium]|nr:hypothetical protein [Candidatus Wildermuthbacteria bacterium]